MSVWDLLKFPVWAAVLFFAWVVSRPVHRFIQAPNARNAATALQASAILLVWVGGLAMLYNPAPYRAGIVEQAPGLWLGGLAILAHCIGDWLEQRANRAP